MLSVFAEFERSIIRERVLSGMARAKAKGTKSGKAIGRPAIAPPARNAIRDAYRAGGVSLRAVARKHNVGVETVRRCLVATFEHHQLFFAAVFTLVLPTRNMPSAIGGAPEILNFWGQKCG